jgi:hypothetical protein
MDELIRYPRAKFEVNKLVIDESISVDEWQELGKALKKVEGNVQFWIGDWARFGERKGYNVDKRVYDEMEEIIDLSRGTLQNYKYVAEKVDPSLRNEGLNFSIYNAVAPLPKEEQIKFLAKAAEENLTVRQLREKIQYGHELKTNDYKGKSLDEWLPEEREQLKKLQAGQTVLINMNKHFNLIKYAEDHYIYMRIDRATPWGNPFVVDEDGNREDVCYWYEHYYYPYKKGLHEKIEKLKGKVLGCHCYPEQCHGETLIKHLNKDFDFENC